MQSIENWISNGRNYQEGVLIYENSKHNKNLLRLFRRKQTRSNEEKLAYELGKIALEFKIGKPTILSLPIKKNNPVELIVEDKIAEKEKANMLYFHQLPEEMQEVLLRAHELFKKNCFLKVRLNALKPEQEDEALKIQLQISDNFTENAQCWEKIDYWEKYRQVPAEPKNKFSELNGIQILRKQQNIYKNISTMKKRFEQNKILLDKAESIKDRTRLSKLLAKQERTLLRFNDDRIAVTKIIDKNE